MRLQFRLEHTMPIKRLLPLILAIFALCAIGGAKPKSMVSWSAELMPADVKAGECAQIVLTAKLQPGWHLYALDVKGPIPTAFEVPKNAILAQQGKPIQPEPHMVDEPGFGKVGEYQGAVAFAIPVKLNSSVSGNETVTVKVTDQTCNASVCTPPETLEVPVKFTVAAGAPRPDHQAAITSAPSQPSGYGTAVPDQKNEPSDEFSKNLKKARSSGLIAFIWFAFTTGLLALLTPCVFPMIPITVSYFAKGTTGERRVNFKGALAYCLGIIGTFTALGIAVTLVFGASGVQQLATNPWLNLVLALIFVVLGLSLFGMFELRLPSTLVNRANAGSKKEGIAGPILMGLTFTLTSFTCTVPFVGTILVAAANGDLVYPIVGMIAFSMAFALPFFLLAMFPQYLAKLPKSGSWLNTVKGFMAFLELAAAVKFLSNADLVWQVGALPRSVFLAIWSIIGVLAAMYLFGAFVIGHATHGTKIGKGRALVGVLMVVATFFCLAGLKGTSLGELNAFLPPDPYPGQRGMVAAGDIHWMEKYSEAVERAKSENRPMFIDFTGVTCTNCRWMEQNMFTRPEVKKLIENYIPVELYTDRKQAEDEANHKLELQLTQVETLPMYVIVSPDGKPLKAFEGSTRNAEEFVEFLQSGSRVAQR